jgi:ABC-2 type transport system permease protein
MTTVALLGVHTKYALIETVRVPIALIGTFVFPALSLLFFVVPQSQVAGNPVWATQAVISLTVFAVMANLLFSFGLGVSSDRETPWYPYLRTLPAPGIVRIGASVLSTGVFAIGAMVPVVVLGALLTKAEATPLGLLGGFGALIVGSLPFAFIGLAIGYSLPSKAAIAVVQVVMFGLAFGGGLFLPPIMFANWLDTLSKFLPSREARGLVIWAVQGGALEPWVWLGLLAWTVVALAVALTLFRCDEGRRYR